MGSYRRCEELPSPSRPTLPRDSSAVGYRKKTRFYSIAEGSLEEVKYFLIPSKDLSYISSDDDLMSQAETVGRLLHGLIASTERRR
jgi:four helix bundle protein